MKFITKVLFASCGFLFLMNCNSGVDKFKLTKGSVGAVNAKTKMYQLDSILVNDSIVKNVGEGLRGDVDSYQVFEKGGKHLLTITPVQNLDSTSLIKNIEVIDSRFKTEKNVTVNSTFQDVNTNLSVSKENINVTFMSVSIFINELNADITLNKDDLGIKGGVGEVVTPDQIPDFAKVQSLIMWFNQNQ